MDICGRMLEQNLQLDVLCGSIMRLNKNVQSISIINKSGHAVENIVRSSFIKQFPSYDDEMLFMQCVLQISMGKDFDDRFGPINYHISGRKNLTMLSFPLNDHVVLVTAKKNVSPISLARKVVDMLEDYRAIPVSHAIT